MQMELDTKNSERVDQLTTELDELRAHHEDVLLQQSLNLSVEKIETDRLKREVSQMQKKLDTKNTERGLTRQASTIPLSRQRKTHAS